MEQSQDLMRLKDEKSALVLQLRELQIKAKIHTPETPRAAEPTGDSGEQEHLARQVEQLRKEKEATE